VEDLKTVCT